jgi:predicted RND superfamily exporter protein/outer membrane lipoprotein-sorting protein
MGNSQLSDKARFFLRNAKRFSLLILLGFVGLGAVATLSLSKLQTEYSMKQFLPREHPLITADDAMKARFQLSDLEPFFALVSLPEGNGNWLDPARMDRLQKETIALSEINGVERTLSLATVEGASSSKEGLTVGRLLELTPAKEWETRILQDPILTPHLITPDARTIVLVVGLKDIPASQSAAIQAEARARLTQAFPGAMVRLGGIPAVQAEMSAVLGEELKNFLGLSLLASMFMLLLFFRSWSSIFVPMVLMVLANVISLAWMAWTGVAFTVLSSTLPVLVAVTVVSMAAHTMLRYASDWELAKRSQDNPNPIRVLMYSYRGLLMPNFLTAVTTAVGFLAIGIADIPLIRQYGLTVGFSIFVCWFVVIAVLFPLLVLFPVPEVRKWTESRARWAIWVTEHKRETLFLVALIAGAFMWKGKTLNWSAQLFDDLPKSFEARATTEFVDSKMGGMIPLDIVIEAKEENAWNDPAALARLDTIAREWRQDQRVGSVMGVQDFLRAAGKVQGRDLPISRAEAAEYGFLYAFSDENPLKKFLTADGRAARVNLRLHDIPGNEMESLVSAYVQKAQKEFPEWKVSAAGMATTVHKLNNELCYELIYGFWQALALIAVLLAFVFRSARWALVSIVPNLLPAVILMGALSFGDTAIKPGIALIFSIALGISFDNTIYLLGRLRLLRERSTLSRIDVTKAWYQEGNLCLFSSLALSAGFLVFTASYFSLNQQFGFYMLVSIAGGLIGDLILLPALLEAFPRLVQSPVNQKEKSMNKAVAASVILALTIAPAVHAAQVDPNNAKSLLDQVEKNVTSQDEVATVKMVITEPDGTKKDRALEIRRKGKEDKQRVLVRMQGPADLKGTALLSVSKGKESDQWLYLPSSKQTRRILSSKKNSSFMDSELSYEDMGTSADAQFESKVLKQEDLNGRKFSVVENTPKGESSYGKILLWIDLGTYLVGKMEYYDKSMKLLKVSTFSGYKQFDKGVWRAQKISVSNVQNKRGTVLELSGLALNKGLEDEEFTEGALTDGD